MTDRREFEFEIDAPLEEVWRAVVDPEALVGWFASEARVTPEVGGEYYVAHGEYGQPSTIEEIVPNERLRTSNEGKTIEFVLEGREGTTVLRIVHSGFGNDELESLERGWGLFVKSLGHFLTFHADDPAVTTYVYAAAPVTIAEARRAVAATLPDGAEVVDELPRSLGARVPELGDGTYRASIEGGDGEVLVWVQLIAYAEGRARLEAVRAEVERRLGSALQTA